MNPSLALRAPVDLLSITVWRPSEPFMNLGLDDSADGDLIRWFDLRSAGDPEELFSFLAPMCDGLTQEMLADLLQPDERIPEGESSPDRRVRLASTFAVYPTATKNGG